MGDCDLCPAVGDRDLCPVVLALPCLRQGRAQHIVPNLLRWLDVIAGTHGATADWPVHVVLAPQQANGNDCGVFVLAFMESIRLGRCAAANH